MSDTMPVFAGRSRFMRRLFALVLFIYFAAGLMPAGQAQKAKLPDQYKKWLEEEVVYIISPIEKEVFLKLDTDRLRDLFIEAFWKQRDPTLATPDNEFKTEHYRRISYANYYYGRVAAKAGWRTDRGHVYIVLGEPRTIEKYESSTNSYAAEVWFYQGRETEGLPAGFNLVFFQRGGNGDFIFYSPSKDGPQALMPAYRGDPMDYLAAYQTLRESQPQLAEYSLSLIPGESMTTMGRPSLASDQLIQKVDTVPQARYSAKYAQKFMEYKDRIEVEYSTNYIDSDALVSVIRDESGAHFVHFALEPQRLSVGQYENKYYTTLKLNGSVADKSGKIIYQFERIFNFDVDEDKLASLNRQPMSIHDMFPLIPGEYKFSILLKNEISKEFASVEKNLVVPGDGPGLRLGPLILGYKASRVEAQPGKLRTSPLRPRSVSCFSRTRRSSRRWPGRSAIIPAGRTSSRNFP
jgi:GWxTD domain-containing protein